MVCLFAISSCNISPCPDKEAFIKKSDEFFKEYDKAYDEIDENKREKFQVDFDALIEDCYKKFKEEMTLVEKQSFWKDAFVFLAKNNSRKSEKGFSFDSDEFDLDPYVEAELEEVLKESGENFAESIEGILEVQLPKVIDKVVDEIGKLGDELKKALENIEINIEEDNSGRQ